MRASFIGYQCSTCGFKVGPVDVLYTCQHDGGNFDVMLDYALIANSCQPNEIRNSKEESLWRYLPLLPVDDPGGEGTPLRAAGWTKVYQPKPLAEKLGMEQLWVKDESKNPTASFKDRASAVLVARAKEIKADVIATASTGNAGAALAGMAAASGQKAVIIVPKSAPPAKVAQLLVYGARVILVDGTYDDAYDLVVRASNHYGWYCRNTGYNPFTAEGKKTASFEIWEQVNCLLQQDSAPLTIFVSVGDGNIISGLHKGFKDLLALGWIKDMPRLIGVQARGSAAIANAYHNHAETITPVKAQTIADSISVDMPRDGLRALRAVRETGGTYLCVDDKDILSGIAELGKVGIFAEPAGAAAYAGLKLAVHNQLVSRHDPVLVMNTGSGLKDVRAATLAVAQAPIIAPTLDALDAHLGLETL